jgi:hypothetical protein
MIGSLSIRPPLNCHSERSRRSHVLGGARNPPIRLFLGYDYWPETFDSSISKRWDLTELASFEPEYLIPLPSLRAGIPCGAKNLIRRRPQTIILNSVFRRLCPDDDRDKLTSISSLHGERIKVSGLFTPVTDRRTTQFETTTGDPVA